jgi:phosphatidylserine decarboxylase
MVKYGIYYSLALIAAGLAVTYFTHWGWAIPLYLLAIFCLNFFRDPDRTPPPGDIAVSPADGKVVGIQADKPGLTRISIFLNVFDVHVNRSPIAGTIPEVRYQPGRFLVASREEASLENEQNTVTVTGKDTTVVFSQIAGLIARRIIFYKKSGDPVGLGERVGLIKFGSRVDVLLGAEWEILIRPGDRVKAGASALARRRG